MTASNGITPATNRVTSGCISLRLVPELVGGPGGLAGDPHRVGSLACGRERADNLLGVLVVDPDATDEHRAVLDRDPTAVGLCPVGGKPPALGVAVERLADGVGQPRTRLERHRQDGTLDCFVETLEVEDVEPGGGDSRDEDVTDVRPVQVRTKGDDGVGRVCATDRAGGEREPVNDPVRPDDDAGKRAVLRPLRLGDAEGADPGFHTGSCE